LANPLQSQSYSYTSASSRQSIFLPCCFKHVTRGFVSRVSRSARERRERSASAGELAQAQTHWLQTHSKDEFGKGWKRAKSSIRADLPLRILGKGVWGLLGGEARLTQTGSARLPAIATVTAVATISAATAAVATTPTTTAAAPAAIATTTAAAAFCLRTRFVNHQVSPAEILPVQGINRPVRIFVTINLDKGKPA
jgi:hypothetical protein